MNSTSRYWGVAAVAVLAVGVNVYSAPRTDADARGQVKVASDSRRLVTGANDHLSSVVRNEGGIAGSGFFEFVPINPPTVPAQSYPAGTSISGNTITIPGGPQRVWLDINFGGWNGLLKTIQATMDGGNGFGSGSGTFPFFKCPLTPPHPPSNRRPRQLPSP